MKPFQLVKLGDPIATIYCCRHPVAWIRQGESGGMLTTWDPGPEAPSPQAVRLEARLHGYRPNLPPSAIARHEPLEVSEARSRESVAGWCPDHGRVTVPMSIALDAHVEARATTGVRLVRRKLSESCRDS